MHMRACRRYALALFIAAVGVAATTGAADATRGISVGPAGVITAASEGSLTFTSGSGTSIVARVTLRASLHNSIEKVRGTLLGYITDCRTSEARVVGIEVAAAIRCSLTLPWHVTYQSFTGTLPTITGIGAEITSATFLIEVPLVGTACLYRGNQPIRANAPSVTRLTLTATAIPLSVTLRSCESDREIRVAGSFGITPTQETLLLPASPRGRVGGELVVKWEGEVGAKTIFMKNIGGPGTLPNLTWEPAGSEAGWEIIFLNCRGAIVFGQECRIEVRPKAGARRARMSVNYEAGVFGSVTFEP